MKKISIVAPAYNEEEGIKRFIDEVSKVLLELKDYDHEILIVNDGSSDGTLNTLRELKKTNNKLSYVSLSRNFGHEIAVVAGLNHATGDLVILMDSDLQHPPSLIPTLVFEYEQGYDVVAVRRVSTHGVSKFKDLSAKLFYKIFDKLSGKQKMPRDVGNFRLMDRKVVDAFNSLKESTRFARGLFAWIGFRTKIVDSEYHERTTGESKYTLRKMIHLAVDGFTSFSKTPLRLAIYTGIFSIIFSMIYLFYILAMALTGNTVTGWASTMVVIIFFGGVQLMFLGVIGEYISKIFDETKNRPLYFVEEYKPSGDNE